MKKRMFLTIILFAAFLGHGQSTVDSSSVLGKGAQRIADSLAASLSGSQKTDVQKIKIIKKDIDYPTYIKFAVGMMAFIAIIYTTTQTWNPSD